MTSPPQTTNSAPTLFSADEGKLTSSSMEHHEQLPSLDIEEGEAYDHSAQYLSGIRLWLALIGM